MGETISCRYSLFDEGRQYSGNHRKYLLENAREICYSPKVREKIKLREALGYYGHGRRVLTGRMDIGETETAIMPDGSRIVIDNVPSNVTTAFDIGQDGTVTHTQEILDTQSGQIVSKLNKSRIGGFSWACPGKDGGRTRPTVIQGFSGFDYVLNPGFAYNRGYLLESAEEDRLLECVSAVIGNEKQAEQIVENWRMASEEDAGQALFEAQGQICDLQGRLQDSLGKVSDMQKTLAGYTAENTSLKMDNAALKKNVRGILECFREKLPFFIPDAVMQEMLAGDFDRAKKIFEDARTYNTSHLPLRSMEQVVIKPGPERREPPEYGSAEYGFNLHF